MSNKDLHDIQVMAGLKSILESVEEEKVEEVVEEETQENTETVEEAESYEDATVVKDSELVDNIEDKEERMGIDKEQSEKMEVPKEIFDACNKRIKEIERAMETTDNKGYNDYNRFHERMIKVINKLVEHIKMKDLESFKEAQILFTTLDSREVDLLPSKLINFLATADKDNEDSEEVIKQVDDKE